MDQFGIDLDQVLNDFEEQESIYVMFDFSNFSDW